MAPIAAPVRWRALPDVPGEKQSRRGSSETVEATYAAPNRADFGARSLREALRAERTCERLFHVFNPSTPGDAFAVSPEGTPRFSQGGGVRHVASRPALVDLEARESLAP